MRVDAAEDVVFQTVFAKETREMHTQKKRVSLRERERKRDAEKDATKKSAESAIYVFKRAPTAASRATREKEREKRERKKRFAFSLRSRGREKKRKETRDKKKNFESGALTSTSTRPPLCELDGLTR